MTVAATLAEYFSTTAAKDLPDAAQEHVRRLLVDYVAVAIAGSRADSGRIARDLVVDMGGRPDATVIGRGDRVPAMNAAFANAIAEHSVELDDIDVEALFHYGPPVVSAALAVGQATHSTGADVLAATVLGCEAMNRLSRATNPALRDRGFHTTPACGVFGAAVAAGRLLELDPAQMTSALGLAGAQAGGLMEMYGTSMQKRFNPGPAARGGVTAAELARRGFTGADTVIDGPRGFGPALAGALDVEVLTAGLGVEVPVEIEFKPYSCARPIHNAIDCALAVRAQGVRPEEIAAMTIRRHPAWAGYHQIAHPRTHHEAQVSLPWSVAVAFIDGAALPPQYADERLATDRLAQSLAGMLVVVEDPGLARGVSCRLLVSTRSGGEYEATVDDPRGSIRNPMSDDELVAKLTMLAAPTVDDAGAARLVRAIRGIDDLADIDELVALTF